MILLGSKTSPFNLVKIEFFQYPQALPAPSSHTPTAMEVRGHLHSWVLVPLPRQDCPKAPGRMPGPSHALSSFGRTTNLCQGHGVVSQVWPNSLPQPSGGEDTWTQTHRHPTLRFRNITFTILHIKITHTHTHTRSQNNSSEPISHM